MQEGDEHVTYGFTDDCRGIEGHGCLDPRREIFGEPQQLRLCGLVHIERVGAWKLGDRKADCVMAVESKNGAVILRAQFRVADISQSHERAVVSRLQYDVVELRGLAEAPHRPHADLVRLPFWRRRLPDLSGRDLHVLFLQCAKHACRRQSALRQFRGIEPKAHGIFALAENNRVANSLDALKRIFDVHVHIVTEEQTVVLSGIGIDAGAEHKSADLLRDDDSRVLDFIRQPPECLVYPVLNVHRRQVDISRYVKYHRDLARSIVAARRADVLHALHAVDSLFQRNGDRGFHRLGVRPNVAAADDYLRRRQVGQLSDRKRGNGDRSCKNDE